MSPWNPVAPSELKRFGGLHSGGCRPRNATTPQDPSPERAKEAVVSPFQGLSIAWTDSDPGRCLGWILPDLSGRTAALMPELLTFPKEAQVAWVVGQEAPPPINGAHGEARRQVVGQEPHHPSILHGSVLIPRWRSRGNTPRSRPTETTAQTPRPHLPSGPFTSRLHAQVEGLLHKGPICLKSPHFALITHQKKAPGAFSELANTQDVGVGGVK